MNDKPTRRSGSDTSLSVIISLVVLAALVGAGAYVWIRRSVLSPSENGRIANQVYTGSCPVIVAEAKGYFASEGIQTTSRLYESGKAALDAVFSGQADLGISADLPVMFAVMNHQPLTVVATITKAENDLGIVGRKDKGIVTPTSLKAKR